MIGTMNILAACSGPDSPVRKFVFKSSAHYYGCEQDDPAFFTERMQRPHPPRTRIERDIVEAEKAVLAFAARNRRRHGDDAALRQRPRARPAHGPHRAALAARRPGHPRLRPALPVHPRGRHRRRARARRARGPAGHLQRRRRRRARAVGDREPARQAVRAAAAAVGDGPRRGAAQAARPQAVARDAAASCASAAASTTASSRRRECRCATPRARRCRRSPSTCGSPRSGAERPSRTATSGKSRSSCATARASGERSSRPPESPR